MCRHAPSSCMAIQKRSCFSLPYINTDSGCYLWASSSAPFARPSSTRLRIPWSGTDDLMVSQKSHQYPQRLHTNDHQLINVMFRPPWHHGVADKVPKDSGPTCLPFSPVHCRAFSAFPCCHCCPCVILCHSLHKRAWAIHIPAIAFRISLVAAP